jgi:hypothetical protein
MGGEVAQLVAAALDLELGAAVAFLGGAHALLGLTAAILQGRGSPIQLLQLLLGGLDADPHRVEPRPQARRLLTEDGDPLEELILLGFELVCTLAAGLNLRGEPREKSSLPLQSLALASEGGIGDSYGRAGSGQLFALETGGPLTGPGGVLGQALEPLLERGDALRFCALAGLDLIGATVGIVKLLAERFHRGAAEELRGGRQPVPALHTLPCLAALSLSLGPKGGEGVTEGAGEL